MLPCVFSAEKLKFLSETIEITESIETECLVSTFKESTSKMGGIGG